MNDKITQIICIDFETGGFDAAKNPATEVGLISFRNDTFDEISRYESYIKPYDKESGLTYTQKALDFTGLSLDKLEKEGQKYTKVVNDLIKEFKKANTSSQKSKKPILLGHNVAFDIPFLMQIFDLAGKDLSEYLDGKVDNKGRFIPGYFDTMWDARRRWPELKKEIKNHKLETVTEKLGIQLENAHEALADVEATMEIYKYFTKSLRNSQGFSNFASEDKEKTREKYQFEF